MKGKVIVIEGLDGSGKGTQTPLLCDFLSQSGLRVRKLSFPCYESRSSELVKMYLSGELGQNADDVGAYAASSFYAVDRYASFVSDWKKDYLSGTVFVADRYATSNIIYQMSKLKTAQQRDEFIEWSEDYEYVKLGIPRPDIVIYLDMPVDISQKLMSGRYDGDENKKDIHEKNIAFLENCRNAAMYAAKKCGWRIVKCSEDGKPLSVDEIHRQIIEIIKEMLL